MRRSLLLLAVLLVLAAGGICLAVPAVNGQKEAVTVTELLRYGDASAAEGLTVGIATNYDGYLHWDTAVMLGGTLQTETSFRFTPDRTYLQGEMEPSLQVSFIGNLSISSGGGEITAPQTGALAPVFRDVAERVRPGTTHTETVRLRDYFDQYPLTVDCQIPEKNYYSDVWETQFWVTASTWLGIPVEEDAEMDVRLSADDDGSVYEAEFSTGAGANLYTWTVFLEDGIYLGAACCDETGNLCAPETFPAGYGVYYLPLRVTGDRWGNQIVRVDDPNVRLVLPVDPARAVISGLDLADDGRLLLRTQEGGQEILTVVDPATMETVQRIPVLEEGTVHGFWIRDGYLAAMNGVQQVTVLVRGTDGRYARKLSASLLTDGFEPAFHYGDTLEAYYDGSRLVLASYVGAWSDPSVELAVCGKEGLLYAARLQHSQAAEPDPSRQCRPDKSTPMIW